MTISHSYRRVQYDLRPAKQAERRMLVDAMLLLAEGGFPIYDYQYTGMGSIHFIDFILFYKYLGITNLLSVEISTEIEKRVKFNRPFKKVRCEIGAIGDYISQLSKDRRHILWLDYDGLIRSEYLKDIVLAASSLPLSSIILVTVDAEPPGTPQEGPKEWREHYIREAEEYLNQPHSETSFARSLLPGVCTNIIDKALNRGIQGRTDVAMLPLFNFEYADGHRMITLGAMIGSETERRMLAGTRLNKTVYFRDSFATAPFTINVPILTRKERIHLDQFMPCSDGWQPKKFELSSKEVELYRDIYRFLPSYAELLF